VGEISILPVQPRTKPLI